MPSAPEEPSVDDTPLEQLETVDISIDEAELERLNPRVRLVWIAQALLTAFVIAVVVGVGAWYGEYPYVELAGATFVVVGVLGVLHSLLRYRIWGFLLRDDSIYLQRGVLIRVQTVVPYVRIQHVDTRRSPIERAVGLASSVIYTAGSRGADVQIPGLRPDRARELQERLKNLANVTGRDDSV